MKNGTKKGKWLLGLTCLLYAGESVLLAGMAFLNGKIVEYAEAERLRTMLWVAGVLVLLTLFDYFLLCHHVR
ncbi:MAG: hypothetical protein NC409_12155 [Clostridium sp.]|nr:hypothetical protein [Clostridium sp.]